MRAVFADDVQSQIGPSTGQMRDRPQQIRHAAAVQDTADGEQQWTEDAEPSPDFVARNGKFRRPLDAERYMSHALDFRGKTIRHLTEAEGGAHDHHARSRNTRMDQRAALAAVEESEFVRQ